MTSNQFGYQNYAIEDGTYFSDTEDKELNFDKRLPPSVNGFDKRLPPSVNQRRRRKDPEQSENYYNKKTSSNTLIDNREQNNFKHHFQHNWEQNSQEYKEL